MVGILVVIGIIVAFPALLWWLNMEDITDRSYFSERPLPTTKPPTHFVVKRFPGETLANRDPRRIAPLPLPARLDRTEPYMCELCGKEARLMATVDGEHIVVCAQCFEAVDET